jgi:hypothetical protein
MYRQSCKHKFLADSVQIFPASDEPWYLPGFTAACATLAFTCIGYASLPLWFLWEARSRKKKTGHAMPLRALEDALHAQVAAETVEREREMASLEVKAPLDEEAGQHLEHLEPGKTSSPKT